MNAKIKKSIRPVKTTVRAEVIEAIKRTKPGRLRDQIGKYPEFGDVICVLKDGFKLVSAHKLDAEREVAGFCVFNGIKDGTIFGPPEKFISLKRLLTPGEETSYEACHAAADKLLSKHFTFRRASITDGQSFSLKGGITTYKKIRQDALGKERAGLRGCLQHIRFRPKGWLLLGTKDEKELAKLVRVSFGQGAVNEMRRTRRLPWDSVSIILARQNQVEYELALAEKQKRKAEGEKGK